MNNNTTNLEPLLQENKDRFVLDPVRNPEIWKMYKQAEAGFWTAEEIDLSVDIAHWANLNPAEQQMLRKCLGFLAASDGIVNEYLAARLIQEVQLPEARCFYGFQIAMGNIHSETYGLLIDTYCKTPEEKSGLFQTVHTSPVVRKKADWAREWTSEGHSFAERLVAFAAFESIFLAGSFCAIAWLKKRDLMPGLCFSNELISRDESLHRDFACLLYSLLENPLAEKEVRAIITQAVTLEKEFIINAFSEEPSGMSLKDITGYIEFAADQLLLSLGYAQVYGTSNPFPGMDLGSLQGNTRFIGKKQNSPSIPLPKQALSLGEDF